MEESTWAVARRVRKEEKFESLRHFFASEKSATSSRETEGKKKTCLRLSTIFIYKIPCFFKSSYVRLS